MKDYHYPKNSEEPEESHMPFKRNPNRHIVFGTILLIAGLVIIGNRLGFISDYLRHLVISWQALVIAIGVLHMSTKRMLSGVIFLSIGVIFLLPKIITIPVGLSNLTMPFALVVIGIVLIARAIIKPDFQGHFRSHFEADNLEYSNDYINEKYVFGGTNLNVMSKNFKGGRIEAVFGGGKINLLDAELSTEGKNVLEVELVFGGIELLIPRDWNVIIKTSSVLGAFTEKSHVVANAIDPNKELVIIGKTVFGGGEIKRF